MTLVAKGISLAYRNARRPVADRASRIVKPIEVFLVEFGTSPSLKVSADPRLARASRASTSPINMRF